MNRVAITEALREESRTELLRLLHSLLDQLEDRTSARLDILAVEANDCLLAAADAEASILYSLQIRAGHERSRGEVIRGGSQLTVEADAFGPVARLTVATAGLADPLDEFELEQFEKFRPQLASWALTYAAPTNVGTPSVLARLGRIEPLLHLLKVHTEASAALLWLHDDTSSDPVLTVIASAGVSRAPTLSVPVGRGLVGRLGARSGLQTHKVEPGSVYNPTLIEEEGWKWATTLPVSYEGNLAGVVALYFIAAPSLKHWRSRVLTHVADLLGLCLLQRRAALTSQTMERLLVARAARLETGLAVLGFAHDLNRSTGKLSIAAGSLDQLLPKALTMFPASDSSQADEAVTIRRESLPPVRTAFSELKVHSAHIARLIASINLLSENRRTKSKSCEVRRSLREIEPLLRDIAHDVALSIHVSGDPVVRGPQSSVERVILNLVTNAVQWRSAHVEIAIDEFDPATPRHTSRRAIRQARQVVIRITDDGDGMQPEVRESCRKPFVTHRDMGTGLGLFIVQTLVDEMNGHMVIESQYLRGTSVTITLPSINSRAS